MRTLVTLLALATPLLAQASASPKTAPSPSRRIAAKPWQPPAAAELQARREAVAARIGTGVMVLVSKFVPARMTTHRYRPDNNLYYLSAIESDPAALLIVAKDGKLAQQSLFLPPYSAHYELWNGARATVGDAAKKRTGIDDIRPLPTARFGGGVSWTPLGDAVKKAVADGAKIVYLDHDGGRRPRRSRLRLTLDAQGREVALRSFLLGLEGGDELRFRAARSRIGPVRAIKSPYEIAMISEAVDITREAMLRLISHARPGAYEFEFAGIAHGVFHRRGATGAAYPPICGSGPNSCVLHHDKNRREARPGELVLCDVGAEYGFYASDITRTFPVSGRFSPEQRKVYEAVLAAQKAGEAALRPGATISSVDQAARRAMIAAGIPAKDAYPHGVGHHVGLHVHDPGTGPLKPGCVITIEPGVYLKDQALGIRIEDVYLVTESGSRRLSKHIPREAEEIQALVGSALR